MICLLQIFPDRLQIFHGVPARGKNIALDVHPEGQDKINNERTAHGQKGDVYKPGPDPGSGDPHPFSDGCTYPEHLPFDEILQSVHTANLKNFDKTLLIIVQLIYCVGIIIHF